MLNPVVTIEIFQKQAEPQIYAAGQIIFAEGQAGDFMLGIIAGEINILVNGKVVETITTGDVFGTGVLVGIKNRTYTAIAKTECKLVSLDERRFLFAVQETPMFALHVIKNYSERLSRLQHMV
ncbi:MULTISPECIES: cyclic nucleotide-binding domain-containing protein [Nostocales]|uniref:cyclic nucleotide-binding domain-containing protein n=1 Tax=Nostocales TaxID=1161 RepID=UPI001683909E|nr:MULTISPECIES: cyclic nucleotide-binding domain-containing protein [Nostocales]MBD2298439.1 cyclic nucleotide-binding domain-containing protein [Nostoc sp. FACHB-190]MBD2488606.1 cyclic nucleotide-binding domain-containing protein [Aulosira sp. FACHB-615]